MPLDTPARIAAERLFILTEAVSDAVVNGRMDEVPALLASRQTELDRLGALEVDSLARAMLERVAASERDLISMLNRSKTDLSTELAQLFSGMRQVRAYRTQSQGNTLQRAG